MERRYAWNYGLRFINLAMRQAVIIKGRNALSYVINIKDISDLKKEKFCTPGIVLFFDKDHEMILWACSYDDVLDIAKEIVTSEIYGYHIIKDEDEPYSEEEIDSMYDSVSSEHFSMIMVNKEEKINIQICLN